MAVAALKHKPKLKTFHATLHVTRVEEWYVEAESLEQARDLLAAGAGYRCQIGDFRSRNRTSGRVMGGFASPVTRRAGFQGVHSDDVISSSANAPRRVKRPELRKHDRKSFLSDDE